MAPSSALVLLISACCLAPVAARADTFAFTISATEPTNTGAYLTSSGTFTTTPDAMVAGALDVTAITGMVNNTAITGLVSGSSPVTFPDTFNFTYDNLLFPSASLPFDSNGLAFTDTNGIDYNVFFNPGAGNLAYESFDGNISFDQQTFYAPNVDVTLVNETAVTPEPSSLLLLGTGLLAMTALLRRRIA